MSNLIITDKHFSMTSSSDVKAIADPFLQDFGANAFIYGRVYDTGVVSALVTYPEYHYEHINQRFLITPPVPPHLMKKHFCYSLGKGDGKFDNAKYCQQQFGIYYPFYIFERHETFFDLMIFTTSKENHNFANHCYNHLTEIDHFKFYFRDKANTLLTEMEKHKFSLDMEMTSTVKGLNCIPIQNNVTKKYKPRHYRFCYNDQFYTITAREYDVLTYIVAGFTSKMTADKLELSHRTVEKYVENAKIRLNCYSKQQMIKMLLASDLFRF